MDHPRFTSNSQVENYANSLAVPFAVASCIGFPTALAAAELKKPGSGTKGGAKGAADASTQSFPTGPGDTANQNGDRPNRRESLKRRVAFSCGVVILISISSVVWATIFGSVRGIVHDPQHRPIQGATVTLKSKSSEWTKTGSTDSNGEFAFNAVPLGDYSIAVASSGFNPAEQNLVVQSGTEPVVHFPLSLASAKETVSV